MRDLAHNIAVVQAIASATRSANVDGAALDLIGFESAALVINTGTVTAAGDFTAKLQEADTDQPGDFADVPAEYLIGTLPATLEANSAYKQGYIGFKRYIRAVLTHNGGTSISVGAVLVKGDPHERPVS